MIDPAWRSLATRASSANLADPRVCIASDYMLNTAPYNAMIYEACSALAQASGGFIAVPELPEHPVRRLVRKGTQFTDRRFGTYGAQSKECDLFLYVCMTPHSLRAVRSFAGWRSRCSKAAAFIFESWSNEADLYGNSLRILDEFDHVFLFNRSSVGTIQKYTNTPCTYMPAAVDCFAATPFPTSPPRVIDVFGMGRTVDAVHQQLLSLAREDKLFYFWDPVSPPQPYPTSRLRTYNFLRRSHVLLSFNFLTPSPSAEIKLRQAAGQDAIPARVFEGAATGALLVGAAPTDCDFYRLFNWTDAFIELPTEAGQIQPFILDLLQQKERLARASFENATQSLRRHDWVHRWLEMADILDLLVTEGALRRRDQLERLACRAEML